MTAAAPAIAGGRGGESWLGLALLTGVLSMTAGSMDVIGFLGLGGLFTAHITGNLVILAAHVVTGDSVQMAAVLSVPVFMIVLCLARLLAGGLEAIGRPSLRPLLLVQFVFLAGLLALCAAEGPSIDPGAAAAVGGGMLGVSAMAAQNALVQVALKGAPATAVITTNVARFTTDIGTLLLRGDPAEVAKAGQRANHIWPSIVGFIIGCGVGAVCEARFGLRALALPVGLALLALAMAQPGRRLAPVSAGGEASRNQESGKRDQRPAH